MIALADKPAVQEDAESLVARYLAYPRPDLRDQIMVQYTPLVERTARKFKGLEPTEDLVQVGYMGLLNALTKFDPDAGVRFNTYATYLVQGEIKHYLRDRAQTIRQPAWLQELRSKCVKADGVLRVRPGPRGDAPRDRRADRRAGVAGPRRDAQAADLMKVGSLDAPAGNDEEGGEIERLDAGDFCPEQLSIEDRLVLEHAMSQLRDLERQVLVLFHFECRPQAEIAERLDISANYVSHILRASLTKLRKILAAEEEQDRLLRRQAAEIDYDAIDAATGAYTEGFLRHRLGGGGPPRERRGRQRRPRARRLRGPRRDAASSTARRRSATSSRTRPTSSSATCAASTSSPATGRGGLRHPAALHRRHGGGGPRAPHEGGRAASPRAAWARAASSPSGSAPASPPCPRRAAGFEGPHGRRRAEVGRGGPSTTRRSSRVLSDPGTL